MTSVPSEQPHPEECLYIRRFKAANENAEYVEHPSYHAHLTADRLWLNRALCIPLSAIRSLKMIKRSGLPNQHALRIIYLDPDTGLIDAVHICDMNLLGTYPVRRLHELSSAIESLLDENGASSQLDDTLEERLPKKDGFIRAIVKLVKATFGSREIIWEEMRRQVAIRTPPEEAKTQAAHRPLNTYIGQGRRDKMTLSFRMISGWQLLWQYFAPAVGAVAVVLYYIVLRHQSAWGMGALVAVAFAIVIAYFFLSMIGSVIMTVFLIPFIKICNQLLGTDIRIKYR